MSVVVVGPLPPPVHGAARVTARTATLLLEAGLLVHVFDTGVDGVGIRYHARRLAVHVRAALHLTTAHGATSVYIGGAGGLGLWYQSVVVLAARLRRAPVVFHHHSSEYLRNRSAAMRLIVALGGGAMLHVMLSKGMAERLRSSYPRAVRTLCVSNCAFLEVPEALAPRPPRASSAAVLGHLSNLSRAKGLHEVLTTFERLLERGHDVALRLAGPAQAEQDRALIDQYVARFPTRIDHVGALDSADVPAFLATLDLFLFPSRYRHEAEPLVVLEAASLGVSTVAYAVGSVAEVVGVVGGWAVPVESPFVDCVEQALAELARVGSTALRLKVHSDVKQFKTDNERSLAGLLSMLTETTR